MIETSGMIDQPSSPERGSRTPEAPLDLRNPECRLKRRFLQSGSDGTSDGFRRVEQMEDVR